jgi:hypothetical protein
MKPESPTPQSAPKAPTSPKTDRHWLLERSDLPPCLGVDGLLNAHEWRLVRQNLRLTPKMIADLLCDLGHDCTPSIVKSWERGASYGPPESACNLIMRLDDAVQAASEHVQIWGSYADHKIIDMMPRHGDDARHDLDGIPLELLDLIGEEMLQALQISAYDRVFANLRAQIATDAGADSVTMGRTEVDG